MKNTLKDLLPQTPGRRVTVIKSNLENTRSPTVRTLQNMKIETSPEEIESTAFLVITKAIIQSTKKISNKTT